MYVGRYWYLVCISISTRSLIILWDNEGTLYCNDDRDRDLLSCTSWVWKIADISANTSLPFFIAVFIVCYEKIRKTPNTYVCAYCSETENRLLPNIFFVLKKNAGFSIASNDGFPLDRRFFATKQINLKKNCGQFSFSPPLSPCHHHRFCNH